MRYKRHCAKKAAENIKNSSGSDSVKKSSASASVGPAHNAAHARTRSQSQGKETVKSTSSQSRSRSRSRSSTKNATITAVTSTSTPKSSVSTRVTRSQSADKSTRTSTTSTASSSSGRKKSTRPSTSTCRKKNKRVRGNVGKGTPESAQKEKPHKRRRTMTEPSNEEKGKEQGQGPRGVNLLYTVQRTGRKYFDTLQNLDIPLDQYQTRQERGKNRDSESTKWSVSVGDTVLVRVSKNDQKVTPKKKYREQGYENHPWYPFKPGCAYCPCQILCIYQDPDRDRDPGFSLMIRYYHFKDEVRSEKTEIIGDITKQKDAFRDLISDWRDKGEEIIESEGCIRRDVRPSWLLGRADLLSKYKHRVVRKYDDDGVHVKTYHCVKYLSDQKELSFIHPETGNTYHGERISSSAITKDMDKILSRYTSCTGNALLKARSYMRGLQYLVSSKEMVKRDISEHLRAFLRRVVVAIDINNDDRDDSKNRSEKKQQDSDGKGECPQVQKDMEENGKEHGDTSLALDDHFSDENDAADPKVAVSMEDEVPLDTDSKSEESMRDDGIWASELPFHVDVSAQKAFYNSISLEPPTEHYEDGVNKSLLGETVWTVKVGDTVAVHVDLDRTARNRVQKSLKDGYDLYPYTVTWWIAEILTIFRSVSTSEGQELREKVSDGNNKTLYEKLEERGSFQVEVRWLYRKVDIPGAFSRKIDSSNSVEGLEEIFETDDVDVIGATSLLGQVMVYSEEKLPQDLPTSANDMPLTHYFSRRSWSLYRKTLIPIGSAENRIQRGMLYSKYMNRGCATRSAFEAKVLKTNAITTGGKNQDWQELFQDAINRLTLAKASAVDHGAQLIGRTNEQKQIKKFLRNAISAVDSKKEVDLSYSNMFSLFIGGPPGTGKTASVTSILYQLRQEQAKGDIPEFTSVSLNGMETRSPFDIYTRLWESVSPNKEKTTADEALARLELYFAGEGPSKRRIKAQAFQKRQIIVLLVDEIDYLVTKKQTVLYNLFDWPVRGYNGNTKAQLIVIGISNTLNLPDRLHVRLQSRIGRERCVFSSYSVNESMNILKCKLGVAETGDQCIFNPDAIKFAARKISADSGDIRKLFYLCRVTAENVFRDLKSGKKGMNDIVPKQAVANIIEIRDVQDTARKMFGTVLCRAVSTASVFEALLFISLSSLRRTSGQERGRFSIEELLTKMKGIASASGNTLYLPAPSYYEVLGMLPRLAEAGIISHSTPNGINGIFGTHKASETVVGLNMEDYEVLGALKDTQHQALAEKHLQSITRLQDF